VPHILSVGFAPMPASSEEEEEEEEKEEDGKEEPRAVSAAQLVAELGTAATGGVAFSAGAACHSGDDGGEGAPSTVLLACGLSPDDARATIRLSMGATTTEADVAVAAARIAAAVRRQLQLPPRGGASSSNSGYASSGGTGLPEPPPPTASRYEDFYRMGQDELRAKFESGVARAVAGDAPADVTRGIVPEDVAKLQEVHAATVRQSSSSSSSSSSEIEKKEEGGKIEEAVLNATAVPTKGAPASESSNNPFFVGYSEEDLSSLWNVHKAIVDDKDLVIPPADGAASEKAAAPTAPAGEESSGGAAENVLGGLHDAVLAQMAASDEEADDLEEERARLARSVLAAESMEAMRILQESDDEEKQN
jgi:hypothetical protein